jgi:hypothetical protein
MAMPYLGIMDDVKPLIEISPRVTDKTGNVHEVPVKHPNSHLVTVNHSFISRAAHTMFPEPMLVYCLDVEYTATKTTSLGELRYYVGLCKPSETYVHETFDCDDFSRAFKENMVEAGYTAVGRVVDFAGGHSYNVVAVAGDNEAKLWLVEPQTGHIFQYPAERKKPYMGNGRGYIEF